VAGIICRPNRTQPGSWYQGLPIASFQLSLSVGSGIDDIVPDPVRALTTVHLENLTDGLADSPTGA